MGKNLMPVIVLLLGVIILSVYNVTGQELLQLNNVDGIRIQNAYDISGDVVFSDIPVPSGNLTATRTIPLPDLYEEGKGFTCTGLAYDSDTNTFLIGEIGALLPSEQSRSSVVRVSVDFSEVIETIPLYSLFPNMTDVQGVAYDTNNASIWVCSHAENKIRNITATGVILGDITVQSPTGIAYSSHDDSFWILSYDGMIRNVNKSGVVITTIPFAYNETLDQCFIDEYRGLLYITAGVNYTSRNNVYCINLNTREQYIACTVDSYAVEGIWMGDNQMIILNDGYYHDAILNKNVANIYIIN